MLELDERALGRLLGKSDLDLAHLRVVFLDLPVRTDRPREDHVAQAARRPALCPTHTEPAAAHVDGDAAHVEGAASEGTEAAAPTETTDAHAEGGGESDTVLGIDVESTPLIVLAVVASLALAAGAWARPDSRGLLTLIGIAMLAFAVLDIREVVHQLDEDETGLALLAGLVALLHLAAAGLAWRLQSSGDASPAHA